MVYLKTDEEVELLRKANLLVGNTLAELAKAIQPGVTTKQLDAIAETFIRDNGAEPTFKGFPNPYGSPFPASICTSVNDVIVHGIPNDNVILKDGDIVNVDLTAEYKGWHGDASRMYMIGNVSAKARELVQTCQDALNAAISICAPGVPLSEIGKTIEAVVKPHGFSISRDFVGHGIGKVMHDDPQIYHFYDKMWDNVKMVPGLVFTIEPMINTGRPECKIDPDGWTARTVDGGLSAQWEHTLGITEDGVTIFTERMI